MSIISLVNQKGGVGKTTVAVHLTHWLRAQSYSVLLVDTDLQQSSANWLRSMGIEAKVFFQPEDILTLLYDLADSYDFLIVDAPANLNKVTQNIFVVSDVVLIPCKPSGLDTNSSVQLIKYLQESKQVSFFDKNVAFFINLAVANTRLLADSQEFLVESGFPFYKTVIHQRQVICDAPGQETVVWKMKGNAAKLAQKEFDRLFKEILESTCDNN